MTDLTNVLGGVFTLPSEKSVEPVEAQARAAIIEAGLEPPAHIEMDGRIHRFQSSTKGSPGHNKPGWYVFYKDGIAAGRFGCWRAGVEITWRADVGRQMTKSEEIAHTRRLADARAARDAELELKNDAVSATVETIWREAQGASCDHPYLASKGIGVNGARVTGSGQLIVPLYSQDGTISSLQYISHDGGKLYHPGGKTGGKFWMLGALKDPGPVYIAEGFATAASIHEATGRPVVVAYSASNLVSVTGIMRGMYGAAQKIVIVADNDRSDVGQRYAEQASAKYGVQVVMPPEVGMDANDYAMAGNDLASLLVPQVDDWLIHADQFSAQPAPICWDVKWWLQANALIMVHGPSGGGKTFVVLDWCLHIAAGMSDWHGNKVKPGLVVYLAGEGHHGLRGRVAAWKAHNNAMRLNAWLSKDGCDLNTNSGYLKVVGNIRALRDKPQIIVVDTLHRFLAGDENSAQDTKTMLDSCGRLMREFGCSVILVHHTGVSEEAQHRARGSSAWRGALDIEISVVPGKKGSPMQIIQRKSKDSELADSVYVDLQQVVIPGWLDEDQQPVTSAVIVKADEPIKEKKSSPIDSHRKTFENAWWSSGAEVRGDRPYVSRSAMLDYLVAKNGFTEQTAKAHVRPGSTGKLIADLLVAEIIEAFEHGWIVVNELNASAMIIRKSER